MVTTKLKISQLLFKIIESSDYQLKDDILKTLGIAYQNQQVLDDIYTNLNTIFTTRQNLLAENSSNPNFITESNNSLVESRKKMEEDLKVKKEETRKKQEERMVQLRIEEEKRNILKETEQQAKVDTGLVFGHWEIVIDPLKKDFVRITHKLTFFNLYYYIELDRMGFSYPYIGIIKDYMKETINMRWNNDMWMTGKYVSAIHKLIDHFHDYTEFTDSKTMRGTDHKKFEVNSSMLNVFPECLEVLEHLAVIYPNVLKHLDDYEKCRTKSLPNPDPSPEN